MQYCEKPKTVPDINDCIFYHTIELPDFGLIKGQWDLRKGIDSYVGNINVKNKTFFLM